MGSCNGRGHKDIAMDSVPKDKMAISVKITPQTFVKPSILRITDVYKMGKTLGSGTFGSVRIVTHKESGHQRAVKIFRKSTYPSKKEIAKLHSEIEILKNLDHPHIIQIYEYFEDPKRFYIIMEKCEGGELYSQIVKQISFTEQDACGIIKQLVSALAYLHSQKIVHRDVKPENILFEYRDDLSSIKLIDFGVASFFEDQMNLKEPVGTLYYSAPEVLNKDYDAKCDLWSCGIITFLLLTGHPPFNTEDDGIIIEKVKLLRFSDLEEKLQSVSKPGQDFIKRLICPASERMTAEQALSHSWLNLQISKNIETNALEALRKFNKGNKIQEAVRTYITSQCLTIEETRELKELFMHIDSNADGKLSKEELSEYYFKVMGDYDNADIENIMEKIDADKNGFVDYSEFIRATISASVINNANNLKLAFKKFDLDNSGKISPEEFKNVLQGSFEYGEEVWKQIVKLADKNRDGEIDFNEFVQMIVNQTSA